MSRWQLAVVLAAALLVASCTEDRQSDELVDPDLSPSASLGSEQEVERAALDELTRIVALALRDVGLRQRVKADMRNSRFTVEHKLPFRNYLHGESGGILLAKMVVESGKSREAIVALVDRVRPLEFYMPVRRHRESWEGGADLLVASLLEDHTVPTAYTLDGATVALDAADPPETPTLAIVPVEANFGRELERSRVRNTNDRGGKAIGTLLIIDPCEDPEAIDCGGGGGGGTPPKPAGLYMTYANLNDDGEGWPKGDPEIEVHIHGPNGGDKTYGADLACAGEHLSEPARRFDQNGNTWSGEVLLFTQSQIENYNAAYGNQGFNVMVWEDDDTACTIKTDKDMTQTLQAIASFAGAAALFVSKPTDVSGWVKAAGAFIGAVYASASWLKSNDDFLGAAPQVTTNTTRNDLWKSGTSKNRYIHTQILHTP